VKPRRSADCARRINQEFLFTPDIFYHLTASSGHEPSTSTAGRGAQLLAYDVVLRPGSQFVELAMLKPAIVTLPFRHGFSDWQEPDLIFPQRLSPYFLVVGTVNRPGRRILGANLHLA